MIWRTCSWLRVFSTNSTSAVCTGRWVKARWWWTSSMLAFARRGTPSPARATRAGRASRRQARRRPARTMPRSMMSASISGSMLPPREHQADALAAKPLAVAQHGGEPRRARAFDHRLLDLQQHHDRLLDVAFVHQQDVAHAIAHDRQREPARLPSRRCRRRWSWRRRRGHALDGGVHRRKALGLHAHHLDVRLDRLGRDRHAGDQAAAADRARSGCRDPGWPAASRAQWCPARQ